MRSVFLALPSYGGTEPETMLAVADAVATFSRAGRGRLTLRSHTISLLALNFNSHWSDALNARQSAALTHFCMLHADVAPASGWLLAMLDEMERVGADVLSCVVPIKDQRGLSSTAWLAADGTLERIPCSELDKLPETFDSSADPTGQARTLLVNTGLWVCDFTKPWVEKVWFEIIDRIERTAEGQFEAVTFPEDWSFSRQCAELGVKVFATRKIGLTHFGRQGFSLAAGDG